MYPHNKTKDSQKRYAEWREAKVPQYNFITVDSVPQYDFITVDSRTGKANIWW